ncbi:MAG: prolyl aminopeptidase [Methylococcales bacterium]|nr:prolyl aminopeptidase [Methylococcales bacterium]
MKTLYPEIEPFHHFLLETNSTHAVYIEQSGNPDGIPVIFLHGGPCSGTKPKHRCYFNPEKYHIILMDQRGSGKSLPYGEIKDNTTDHLINDMEQVRQQLKIERWHVFGGSWGSTLSLLYAQKYTDKVLSLVLRGTFLAREKDLNWFAGEEGVSLIYPEKWRELLACVDLDHSNGLVKTLYNAILGDNEALKKQVTKAWMNWGGQVVLMQDYQEDDSLEITEAMVQLVRMELHYAHHHYFIDENQVLDQCDVLQQIPTTIIHGQNDLVCPMEAGFVLSKKLPHATYIVLPHSGHIASGDEMVDALVQVTNKLAGLV